MASVLILLLLPALAYSKFTIDIDLRGADPLVDVRGGFTGPVEDDARKVFHVTDEELIRAVSNHRHGVPDKVYVKRNENLKAMYEKHGFYDVVRRVKANLDIITTKKCAEPEALHLDHADMEIITDWRRGGNLSVDTDYDIYIESDQFSFNTTRGQKLSDRKEYSFGKTIDLISECSVKITVLFESILEGDIVAQYSSQYNGHYFWAYDLAKLHAEGILPNKYITEEMIDITYYV